MKLHKYRVTKGPWGSIMTSPLCGRSSLKSDDGANVADTEAEVTCKFCLSLLARMTPEQLQRMDTTAMSLLAQRSADEMVVG